MKLTCIHKIDKFSRISDVSKRQNHFLKFSTYLSFDYISYSRQRTISQYNTKYLIPVMELETFFFLKTNETIRVLHLYQMIPVHIFPNRKMSWYCDQESLILVSWIDISICKLRCNCDDDLFSNYVYRNVLSTTFGWDD